MTIYTTISASIGFKAKEIINWIIEINSKMVANRIDYCSLSANAFNMGTLMGWTIIDIGSFD